MSGRFPFYPEHIPGELKDDDAWVCCDEEKVPHIPLATGRLRRASSTDPETWRSYEEAEAALASGRYYGIGFVFSSGDSYAGVDLDGCRNPETGEIETWAKEIIEHLDSYTELSPSGTGVHVLVKAELPLGGRRKGVRKEAVLPNEDVNQDWVGYPEARRLSGLSRATLRRLVRNGQLRATKVGRATRIERHSLEVFVENHPTQPRLPGFEDSDA
jgi:excisionase family DNA binding protein